MKTPTSLVLLGAIGLGLPSLAAAGEIRVATTPALESFYEKHIHSFEKSSGHKVTLAYGGGSPTRKRVEGNECDVAVGRVDMISGLEKKKKVVERKNVAFVGIGVEVQPNAPIPDISSVDAFKKTLLNAKSIAHGDPAGAGASGQYLGKLMSRLGIADQLKGKTKYLNARGIAKAIRAGEVEIGITQISEIMGAEGVKFVGPLPAEIQNNTEFAAAIVSTTKVKSAATDFIKFLISDESLAEMKKLGLERMKN